MLLNHCAKMWLWNMRAKYPVGFFLIFVGKVRKKAKCENPLLKGPIWPFKLLSAGLCVTGSCRCVVILLMTANMCCCSSYIPLGSFVFVFLALNVDTQGKAVSFCTGSKWKYRKSFKVKAAFIEIQMMQWCKCDLTSWRSSFVHHVRAVSSAQCLVFIK